MHLLLAHTCPGQQQWPAVSTFWTWPSEHVAGGGGATGPPPPGGGGGGALPGQHPLAARSWGAQLRLHWAFASSDATRTARTSSASRSTPSDARCCITPRFASRVIDPPTPSTHLVGEDRAHAQPRALRLEAQRDEGARRCYLSDR